MLILILMLLGAATILTQTAFAWRIWGIIALLITLSCILEPHVRDAGFGYALGMAMLLLTAIGVLIILGIKCAIDAYRKKKITNHRAIKILRGLDIGLCVLIGLCLGFSSIKFLAFSLAAFPGGYVIHAVGIILSIIGIYAMWRCSRHYKDRLSYNAQIIIGAFCAVVAFFSLSGLFLPFIVLKDAKRIAQSDSYCISLNHRNRALQSLQDLTLFTMDKGTYSHHITLLVTRGDQKIPYYWSYYKKSFIQNSAGLTGSLPVHCFPAPDYAKNIPWINTQGDPPYREGHFKGGAYRIDSKYTPFISGTYLSIAVEPPDFTPVERMARTFYPSMEITGPGFMEHLVAKNAAYDPHAKPGMLHEIRDSDPGADLYYAHGPDGKLISVVSCYNSGRPGKTSCQHRFYRNGAMYSFNHARADLNRSPLMEDRLYDLFTSFYTSELP